MVSEITWKDFVLKRLVPSWAHKETDKKIKEKEDVFKNSFQNILLKWLIPREIGLFRYVIIMSMKLKKD